VRAQQGAFVQASAKTPHTSPRRPTCVRSSFSSSPSPAPSPSPPRSGPSPSCLAAAEASPALFHFMCTHCSPHAAQAASAAVAADAFREVPALPSCPSLRRPSSPSLRLVWCVSVARICRPLGPINYGGKGILEGRSGWGGEGVPDGGVHGAGAGVPRDDADLGIGAHVPDVGGSVAAGGDKDVERGVEGERVYIREMPVVVADDLSASRTQQRAIYEAQSVIREIDEDREETHLFFTRDDATTPQDRAPSRSVPSTTASAPPRPGPIF
jgi:hypothetical protein